MDRSQWTDVELFSELSEDELDLLVSKMKEMTLPPGSLMTEEGDVSDRFFVILAGSVTVHRDGHHLADLSTGDFFGESGTTGTPGPRNATVIATTPVRLGSSSAGTAGDGRRATRPPAPCGECHADRAP